MDRQCPCSTALFPSAPVARRAQESGRSAARRIFVQSRLPAGVMTDISEVDPTCPLVRNLLLLDSEGKRIAVKYYAPEWSNVHQQANYEKSVYAKTNRINARGEAEIIMFDDVVVVFKFVGDLMFYVTGHQDENEVILFNVLTAFVDSVTLLLRNAVEKKTVLENLDLVLLSIDEIIDGGVIMETDPGIIAGRVTMRTSDDGGSVTVETLQQNPGLQSLSQAFASAKEQLTRSLLK